MREMKLSKCVDACVRRTTVGVYVRGEVLSDRADNASGRLDQVRPAVLIVQCLVLSLQGFDAVGWAAGRASGP